MHDFIYTGTHTHTHTLTPIYLCDFSYFFYLCYDKTFPKFLLRFKALPVIQILVSLKSDQKDLKFVFVIVVCEDHYVKTYKH